MRIAKIISGGQTGADRAGLDAAIAHGILHGGYCPAARLAEDGVIPTQYQLVETISKKYPARTKANVKAADLTLIFYIDGLKDGSLHTKVLAEKLNKPCLAINLSKVCDVGQEIENQYPNLGDIIVNIAGSRVSSHPGIYSMVYDCLCAFLLEQEAKHFVCKYHEGQLYGTRPYIFHLERTVEIAKRFHLSHNIIVACWLHDTIEDCDVSYEDMERQFGTSIASIVYAVSDEPGANRKERKVLTYPKIRANNEAIEVKLCDRIANVSQCSFDNNTKMLEIYRNEYADFRKQLYVSEKSDATAGLWGELEGMMLN